MAYCLAIDIGASSGRHILGEYVNGQLEIEEIYRFDNGLKKVDGYLSWDIEYLAKNVIEGIKKCAEIGKIPETVAIDTWGVDYVLLDKDKKEILPAVSYRDSRTDGIPEEVDKIINKNDLYEKTGIQRANYNTIYQLYCDKKAGRLENAEYMLMMPEYLSYVLTGVMKSEYTIASTSSLLNAYNKNWDMDIINKLGIKPTIFNKIEMPSSEVGNFTQEVKDYVGFDATVVFAPSHDTASAVAACTLTGHGMYISSGTWSLIGAQNNYPVLTEAALKANFTNEGGIKGTYRFLKNIMGMWLIQSIRNNLGRKYSFQEMMDMSRESKYTKTFDPNDPRLVAPENMIEAIQECLGEKELPLADIINSVYNSLAASYAEVVKEIETVTGETVDCINIVGGGSQATYLNELTEKYTQKPVTAGPVEATAIGNLKAQFDYLAQK